MHKFRLVNGAPMLTRDGLHRIQQRLTEYCALSPLPESYQAFLLQHNGGWVSPGPIDSETFEHKTAIVFDTPLHWARDNQRPVCPELVYFFCAYDDAAMRPESIPETLYELVASNRYSREDFDVLPSGMMSIAKVQHPDAADMLCISLHARDFGAVYYQYGMSDHPANFHGDYYERRYKELTSPFGEDAELAIDDEDHPLHTSVNDAIARVPFVRVGDSFEEWLQRLRVVEAGLS
jgi:hypothetical protein